MRRRTFLIGTVIGVLTPAVALAKGNLATKPTDLKLKLSGDLSMSAKEFRIETGKYYKLAIECEGGDEFHWMAPDLFRSSWVYQVVINGIEIHNVAAPEIEFDKDGTAIIYFVPIRTGRFRFWIKGQEPRGMIGEFIVE